jgi:tyrosyl-tRNA synthetase
LQKVLAEELTVRVHGREEFIAAVEASEILFGKATTETLKRIKEDVFLSVFEGVPQFEAEKEKLPLALPDLLVGETGVFASRGELRRLISGGGLSINKEKVEDENLLITTEHLINGKYMLVQKGKKNYSLIRVKH